MEQYALYLLLKEIIQNINNSFKISFNDMNLNGVKEVCISVKGGTPSKYRELATGRYYNYSSRVQILIQSGLDKSSLFESLNLATNIRDSFTTALNNNKYKVNTLKADNGLIIEDKDNSKDGEDLYLQISSVHLIGETDFKGKTSQGQSRYSINFMFNYNISIGGN